MPGYFRNHRESANTSQKDFYTSPLFLEILCSKVLLLAAKSNFFASRKKSSFIRIHYATLKITFQFFNSYFFYPALNTIDISSTECDFGPCAMVTSREQDHSTTHKPSCYLYHGLVRVLQTWMLSIYLDSDRDQWRALVNMAMNLRVP
jgi:hypothetical protein